MLTSYRLDNIAALARLCVPSREQTSIASDQKSSAVCGQASFMDVDIATILADETPDAVVGTTQEGVVVYWNKGAEAMFG